MDKIIKVVQIHYSVEASGSAAWRLHNAFNENGIQSILLVHKSDKTVDESVRFAGLKSKIVAFIQSKFQNFLNRKNLKEWGLFSYPIFGIDLSKRNEVINADVIYLHWILLGYLNFASIEKLAKLNKPIVIIMHDMWYITGGCHNSFTCENYTTTCHSCPILPGTKENDLSTKEFKKKLKLYSKYSNLYFVSPSLWLYNCAVNSLLTNNKPVFHIPNLVDKTLFKKIDKHVAKKILNIPIDEPTIAFGAVSLHSPYKGGWYLQKALQYLYKEEIQNANIIFFGGGDIRELQKSIPFKSTSMGYVHDEYTLMLIYNAADVFVVPSIADNLPTTVLESLRCGTPVAGFNVGGIPDMIQHKENGYLAKYKDYKDLALGIKWCIDCKKTAELSSIFDPEIILKKHINLLDQIL